MFRVPLVTKTISEVNGITSFEKKEEENYHTRELLQVLEADG